MKQLSSAFEVVQALGGPQAVASMTGRSYKSVWRWQGSRFPAATYFKLQSELAAKKMTAPASLWRMTEAA